jgi:peptide/nickel transport system substrate-binding protein
MHKMLVFVSLALLVLTGSAFAGGQQQSQDEGLAPAVEVGAADISQKEAPMLAQRVAAGELPPLDQRLPENPLVLEPIDALGRYGGTLRLYMSPGDYSTQNRTVMYERGTRWPWDSDFSEVYENVFEEIVPSEDASVFTVHLREGMRWSDGEPFTAEDVTMIWETWYEYKDDFHGGKKQAQFVVNGKMPTAEIVNDYTVRIHFGGPFGIFPQLIAHGGGWAEFWYPKHYLQQFHPLYVGAEKAQQLADAAEFNSWRDHWQWLWNAKKNPDLPVLYPWIVTETAEKGVRMVMERNPYYWKVDPQGRQLPYIDRVIFDVYQNLDTAIINVMNGNYDLSDKGTTLDNFPVFLENRDKGSYRLTDRRDEKMNMAIINFNHNHPDPVKRELFNTPAFKIGVSHAIDRVEINELIYRGQGTPMQPSPRPESPFYHEEYANAYLEYDTERANALLDEAGLTQRDSEGFRLNIDGSKLLVLIESSPNYRPEYPDLLELLKKYLREVGVRAEYKIHGQIKDMSQRQQAGQHDAMLWHGDGGMAVLFDARYYIPSVVGWSSWAPAWAQWYTSAGSKGEEPPAMVREMMSDYDRMLQSSSLDEQRELMRGILDRHAENLFVIGTVMGGNMYNVVHNRLQNVPEWWWSSWPYPDPGPIMFEQLWVAE